MVVVANVAAEAVVATEVAAVAVGWTAASVTRSVASLLTATVAVVGEVRRPCWPLGQMKTDTPVAVVAAAAVVVGAVAG